MQHGSVSCTSTAFNDPFPSASKECRMALCGADVDSDAELTSTLTPTQGSDGATPAPTSGPGGDDGADDGGNSSSGSSDGDGSSDSSSDSDGSGSHGNQGDGDDGDDIHHHHHHHHHHHVHANKSKLCVKVNGIVVCKARRPTKACIIVDGKKVSFLSSFVHDLTRAMCFFFPLQLSFFFCFVFFFGVFLVGI
jgi:hypothetical protein